MSRSPDHPAAAWRARLRGLAGSDAGEAGALAGASLANNAIQLIFTAVPEPLLRIAFGPDTVDAAPALVVLGLAMTLLAVAYLTVQFLIALGRVHFLGLLAGIIAIELSVLFAGSFSITGFASVVAGVQLLAAAGMVVLALRAWPGRAAVRQ